MRMPSNPSATGWSRLPMTGTGKDDSQFLRAIRETFSITPLRTNFSVRSNDRSRSTVAVWGRLDERWILALGGRVCVEQGLPMFGAKRPRHKGDGIFSA